MAEFQPSPASLSPAERTLATIRYLRKTLDAIEAYVEKEGALPPWVIDKMHTAAALMAVAVGAVVRLDQNGARAKTTRKPRRKT